jgi:hypothetical protein
MTNNFGGWAIQESCYEFIKKILPEGSTILELGSGIGTDYLSKHYKMYSIENYIEWINKYDSEYIFAPIKNYDDDWTTPDLPGENGLKQSGWYNPMFLEDNLPEHYDLILIDGPNGIFGRGGFLKHLDMFNTNVPMIFDDIDREAEYQMIIKVSEIVGRPWKSLDKHTGYIL